MSDNEKRENLANARRKLKKFRDQQPNIPQTNGNDVHSTNGTSIESTINHNIMPQTTPSFFNEQQSIVNGIHPKSPFTELEGRTRLEDQRRLSSGSSMSGRASQTPIDIEQKLRRDLEHLQEQLEIHVQTIGILVAEKTDVSAKLTQSFKQLERKQSEMDELHGRLKASRERVQELEKQMQNSTSNVQKREMAAKESDKENDRLKIENIRQSQLIEDLKQNINEFNEKLRNKQNIIDQLNNELKQPESSNEIIITEQLKNNQIEELLSSLNRLRSDNEQYQQYNTSMQHHIQELNDQINQSNQAHNMLQIEYDAMKKKLSDQGLSFNHDNLQQENQLFRNAIDQWSSRYEELRIQLEQTTKLLTEKDERIAELNNSKDSIDQNQTENEQSQQQLIERFNRAMHENAELKDRTQHLEHVILQLQSETETIGDYIYLYQQQREQLQRRYQEKDDYIKQLTQDRFNLQKKISELEILLIRNLNLTQPQQSESNEQIETNDNASSIIDQTMLLKTTSLTALPQLSDETKARILALIQELGQNNLSSTQNENLSTIKQAFVDKIFIYVQHVQVLCSGCKNSFLLCVFNS